MTEEIEYRKIKLGGGEFEINERGFVRNIKSKMLVPLLFDSCNFAYFLVESSYQINYGYVFPNVRSAFRPLAASDAGGWAIAEEKRFSERIKK